jgi:hypothetical protein
LPSISTAEPKGRLTELKLFAHQEIEFRALDTHDLILSFGGIGSGKTTSLVLWLLWLMKRRDFAQVHALFALTTTSLRAVSRVIDKQLDRIPAVRNRERTISTRPPRHLVEDWERRGVVTPPKQDRYENIRIWPCGLHVQMGTVHNKSYEQYRGAEWGSLAAEEVGLQGFTRDAFDFLDERVRCGDSDEEAGIDCRELYGHRHIKILHTNPPEAPDHWSWQMLDALEREASDLPGATPKAIGTDGYPNLISGIGPAILIPSRTTDNTRLPKRYVESKVARLDAETAARRLGGALTRTREGRVYTGFTRENEHEIAYHRDRTVYVTLDFNNRPIAGGLWHPLNPGEYPSEHERSGIKHVGKFGEIFDTQGGGLQALCALLLGGGAGNSGSLPPNWQGLTEHKAPVVFFGDGTGLNKSAIRPNTVVDRRRHHRQATARTRHQGLAERYPAKRQRPRSHPLVQCEALQRTAAQHPQRVD